MLLVGGGPRELLDRLSAWSPSDRGRWIGAADR
jgi:hypothetical protein